MSYSMFECPKLHNAKSLKFYPEEYTHQVPFRHKNLPPDFELTVENTDSENYSIQVHSSSHKKCPIYVHHFDGDFVPKSEKKAQGKKKAVIRKLEETYWANWKPDKNETKSPEIQVIKSAPDRRRKIKVYPKSDQKVANKSQEIQTDELPQIEEDDAPVIVEETPLDAPVTVEETPQSEEDTDTKFLKHTDSFILNVKKQKEEKEHFDQPKCIRLYRKPGKMTSKNIIKGGSYPLKSCLKKESNVTKGSVRGARPGSPIIVSSSFSTRGKSKFHRH